MTAVASGKATAQPSPQTRARAEVLLVVLLLAASLAMRVYRLEAAPPGLQHDEGFNAHDARKVLEGVRPVFFDANFGREAFFMYLMAGFIAVIGYNPWAVRLPAVACGVGGQLLLYLLMRRLFGRRAALLTLAITTISFWHLFESRVGLRAISLPLLMTLSLYWLWLGFCGRRRIYWLLSGAAMGLTLYTYLAARIAPLVPVLFLAYLVARDRKSFRGQWLSLALWLVVAVAVFAPFGVYMLRHGGIADTRLRELSFALDQLMAGNPRPVLDSTLATLGMFTFKGDTFWRYNLAGQPVFGPVLGLLFYVGLLVSLWRWREPGRALLLLWLVVMLLPSALARGAPSFLRSTGAMPPVLALPALALSDLGDWLRPRLVGRGRALLLAALAVGLMAAGVVTCYRYFVVWANEAWPRIDYKAEIAEAAHYLNALPDQPLVCISSNYARDLDRYIMDLQLTRPRQIKWFDGQTFVLPAPSDKPVLYIFTASAPLPEAVAQRYFAGLQPVYRPLDPRGVPVITAYRLAPDVLARLRQLPAPNPLQLAVGQDVELLGWSLPAEARQGEPIRATVFWQPRQAFSRDFSDAPWFGAGLVDAEGRQWATKGGLCFAPWDWTPGDMVLTGLDLTTGYDFPLQPYWAQVGMVAPSGPLQLLGDDGQAGGYDVRLPEPVQLLAAAEPAAVDSLPIQTRAAYTFGDVALCGYTLPGGAAPGQEITLALFWQALARPRDDYQVRIRLTDTSGKLRYEKMEPLWPGVYPTSRWYPGGFVRSYHAIAVPADADTGPLSLGIGLVDSHGQAIEAPGAERAGSLQVKGRERLWSLPADVQHPLQAELGDAVALLGYSTSPASVAPGETLQLTLFWQARRRMDTSYKVFTHVLGAGNWMAGQKDSLPGDGSCPTTGWLEGEIVVDHYAIPLKPDAPAGDYVLEVGMYEPTSGQRLPVTVGGTADPDRRVNLGTIVLGLK